MSLDFKDLEDALLSSRDEFVSRQEKAFEQAQQQFGKHKVRKQPKMFVEAPVQTKRPAKRMAPSVSADTGYIVKLGVREKQIAMNEIFVHHSKKGSELEARFEAEKAANKAGYPIIGYIHSITKAEKG